MDGNVTSVGWQVTLCDPMWHVSSRSGEATLRTAIHLLLTYLLTFVISSRLVVGVCTGCGYVRIHSSGRQLVSQYNGDTYWPAGGRTAVRSDRHGAVSLERLLGKRLQNPASGGLFRRESRVQYLGGRDEQSSRFQIGADRLLFPAAERGNAR